MTNVLAGITKADIERAAKAIARMIPTESGHWNIGHGEDFPTQYSVAEQRLIRAIVATTLTAALAGRVVVPAWTDGNPPVKRGGMNEFALAVYRQHSGKVYSFAASYLNAHPLTYDYECPKGSGCEGKGCDDGCPTTGWFVQTGEDGDATTFHNLSFKDGDKIMGWTEIPRWSAAVSSGQDGTP